MILCIGEILVDMIGSKNNGLVTYSRYAGGAPFNVCCGIANYGGKASFLGTVGNDIPGKFLIDFASKRKLQECLIDVNQNRNTTLAFVENDENGERSFCFYRKNTADYILNESYFSKIKDYNIIHIGSLMLSEKEGREAFGKICEIAKENHKKISFDVNYREDIFTSREVAIKCYLECISKADILKFSLEELEMFTGLQDYKKALEKLVKPEQMTFVTLGKDGSVCYYKEKFYSQHSIMVKPVDTTGCGDAFYAATLKCLDEMTIFDEDFINKTLKFANVSGALVATKKGAIDSLPTIDEIKKYL